MVTSEGLLANWASDPLVAETSRILFKRVGLVTTNDLLTADMFRRQDRAGTHGLDIVVSGQFLVLTANTLQISVSSNADHFLFMLRVNEERHTQCQSTGVGKLSDHDLSVTDTICINIVIKANIVP